LEAANSLNDFLLWLALAAAAAPILGAGLWVLWQGLVRPQRIPRGVVEQLAAMLLELYGERAGEVAFAKECRAWHNSDNFAQGKWRRVRRLIEARQMRA
jgi:hypothetical protein